MDKLNYTFHVTRYAINDRFILYFFIVIENELNFIAFYGENVVHHSLLIKGFIALVHNNPVFNVVLGS